MRYRRVFVLIGLIGFALLGRYAIEQEETALPPNVEATVVPTPDGTGTFDIADWDLDGDGAFSTSEIGPAALAYAENIQFAPGYDFDRYRFEQEYRRTGDSRWAVDSLTPVMIKGQTCSWVQYWLDSEEAGDSAEATRALDMLTELQTNEALGEHASPIGFMVEAAAIGDAERVQVLFTGARCHLTFFVDDSIGPQGLIVNEYR